MRKHSMRCTRRTLLFSAMVAGTGLLAGCQTNLMRQAETVAKQLGGTGTITTSEYVAAVRQALLQGAEQAVRLLGRPGGFLTSRYRIPPPREVRPVLDFMRRIGQGRYADQFETTLNRAAERAVPAALSVFRTMIREMTVEDALRLIRGGETAITDYFRRTQDGRLRQRFLPIVRQATAETGVTRLYGRLQAPARQLGIRLPDVNAYVTDRALQALYAELAAEERAIRRDPLRRTTEILRKVFGQRR